MYNDLENCFASESQTNNEDVKLQSLKKILDFTKEHFSTEEHLMEIHGYPGAAQHRRLHKDFDTEVYQKYRLVLDKKNILTSEILALIKNGLLNIPLVKM